jgi:hypothetical protein
VDCAFDNVTFEWNGTPGAIQGGNLSCCNRFETQNPVVMFTVDILNMLGFTNEDFRRDWRYVPTLKKN